MLFPLQPGDPTKLPAAILRGAPFGLSSPAASQHVLAIAAACACAYPLYKRILRRGREKHAEEILRLGDELLGGKERSENDDAHADADGGDD